MSDSKNQDDNSRYREGYGEGRSGSFDPLKRVVEEIFFGGDQIKDAGRSAGVDDRHRYDGGKKQGSTFSSQSRSGARTSKSTSSSGKSHRLSGGGLRYSGDTFELVLGLLMLAGVIAYVVWVIVTMNSGGPETLGEFIVLLPGLAGIAFVAFYVGIFVLGVALIIGVVVLIFKVIIGG